MVHVWYVQYGDTAQNIDPSAVYEGVLAKIREQDTAAYIEEIRQYQYQIAFYVNHPTWVETTAGLVDRDRKGLIAPIFLIILIGIGITTFLATVGYVITAIVNYQKENRYYADEDPVTGEKVKIWGWSAYLAWLSVHRPEALQKLKDYNATNNNWWETIIDILPLILILIGAAIAIPLIVKLIPGKEGR